VNLLIAAVLLLPLSSWGQQASNQQQPTTSSTRRQSHGGGGGRSSHGGNDATSMKELPCPKGFTAQTDSGPHLQTTTQTPAKSGRRKTAGREAAQTPTMRSSMARRCVPDKPKKEAAATRKNMKRASSVK
jgi:hypothetical protein